MFRIIDLDAEKDFKTAYIPISSLQVRPILLRGVNALTRSNLYGYQELYSFDPMSSMFLAIIVA